MNFEKEYDLICVGGGIMSANLVLLAKLLNPNLKVLILERLDEVAKESSAAWNNAGTGHSALCELNYCPEKEDGSISIEKAIKICTQFETSKQFWSYLVENSLIDNPEEFVNPVKHHSWVTGKENSDYLEKRYKAFKNHFMFDSIEFTREQSKMNEWFPLIMNEREEDEIMAASRMDRGTEVNYGVLTKKLFTVLEKEYNTPVYCNMEVEDIDPDAEEWTVEVKNTKTNATHNLEAKHVFIGAGGGSLLLLQKVEILEKEGYGGFPVSGEWLVCKNEEIIKQHNAKVYSKAGIGDPPMSTPHLDTRYINGKRELLFGPFAGFSPKFLKEGSYLDLVNSIKTDNLPAMFGAFWHNLPLTKYLIEQVLMDHSDRMEVLRKFMKNAKAEDWELLVAGQRVQIIKKDEFEGGKLQFGTEVISSKDGSITCLLGASPGASTATSIMLEVLEKAFPEIINSNEAKEKLEKIVPFYKNTITEENFKKQLKKSKKTLKL
ncbi:malate:quinone oxidoreductase [Tenacibaculum holothuriorum]|uniref:Probable malate:quinone oxidoreductase n=1 Tax=Tenacibaculum holothuriorum TaxID=1635173 RepID=A0A1Y2PGT6_9FLAO|nr:malate dehydrogenase (quinone) [Tenacibaculum holothuriorum]OSY89380.1 malate:quinone oxidoreductase [Tenacibaculum holothuriorum]